ncbi:MAG: hypothetical protein ACI4P4_05330 [Faecousia sp.]
MSRILCIVDGMTDPSFCFSEFPNLASMGQPQYVDTTQGSEAESFGCILRLLGVKTIPPHLRGYAEALGNGIPVGSNDLVLRGSWFSLDDQGRCTVPVPGPEVPPVLSGCRYYALEQYKCLLVFPEMAGFVSNMTTYPPFLCEGQHALRLCPKGCGEVSRIFTELFEKERCLIPWGQAVCTEIEPYTQKAAVVCGTAIVKGIARLLNMDLIPVSGATGDVDTDLNAKAFAALEAAETYPFVLLHINGADEAAHRKNSEEKRSFLRKIDELVLPKLLSSGNIIHVAADHGTDPVSGLHLRGVQPMFTVTQEK